jgi:uncharacterized protein YbjT (DUF2867 family)
VQGDVRTGEGLGGATADTDVVVHAATSARRRARATEVDGTRQMLAAATAAGAHFIYVSIVGVDRIGFPYYRAKWAAEQLVEAADRWTIQRATQFHQLLDSFLAMRLFPATKHMAFQPVDPGEVSDRLVDLVDAGPSGRVEDFGGPEVVPLRQLNATRRAVTGRRAFILPAPPVGFLRGFDEGHHLCPDGGRGLITWESWQRSRVASS